MTEKLNILICDDDAQFATNLKKQITRKLWIKYALTEELYTIETISQASRIPEIIAKNKIDAIFCDLGWGDQNLEGIQILNDAKINHPHVQTVLYTAQEEDEIISQALHWKLSFVDQIIHIHDQNYFSQILQAIYTTINHKRCVALCNHHIDEALIVLENHLAGKTAKELSSELATWLPEIKWLEDNEPSTEKAQTIEKTLESLLESLQTQDQNSHIKIRGTRLLPEDTRATYVSRLQTELNSLHDHIKPLLKLKSGEELSAKIDVSSHQINFTIRANPSSKNNQRYLELINNLGNFPRLENHDVLALDKVRFIEFVKAKYTGFPQMAEQTGLDLNNIYRVNRKFKQKPFIVFKLETIREIVGIVDSDSSDQEIKSLLAKRGDLEGALDG